MTAWTIIGFLTILISQERIMGVFYDKRRTSFRNMVLLHSLAVTSFFIMAWVMWGGTLLVHNVGHTLAMTLPTFIISLNYKSFLTKRLAVVACYYLIVRGVIQSFLHPLFFLTYTFGPIDIAPYAEMILGVLSCLAILLLRLFKNIKEDLIDVPKIWIPALFVPIAYMSLVIFSSFDLPNTPGIMYISMLGTAIILLGSTFLIFFLYNVISGAYKEKLKSELDTQEKEYYFTQCQLMQESVDKMKSYRHDVRLHLTALRDFTVDNRAATDYLNNLLGGIGESEVYSDTGNIAFDSIINFKLKDVISENINLTAKVFVPPALNIEVSDVVIILGNLLDNAFKAVARVEDKMINLIVESNKGNLFIKVDNTFDGKVTYAEGISGARKSITTQKDGDSHGYGLKNIQKSVEKYNGHIDITHEDNIFSVGILLYVDDM